MMTALATVTSVRKTARGNEIGVSCEQQTSCSHCASQKSCGTGIISNAVGSKSHKWQLLSDAEVEVGQIVQIGLSEKKVIQFASLVYLLPLGMLMLGAAIGELILGPAIGTGEGITILTAALFMGGGFWLSRYFSVKLQATSKQSVTLIKVLGNSIDVQLN